MHEASFRSISEKNTKLALFLFFSLLILSAGFFVFADDNVSMKNIFQDSDQDGLSNDEEKLYGTDPFNKDTDDDGYGDGIEVESGYDPLKHSPGDKIIKENETSSVVVPNETENLTQKVSGEIAGILKNTNENGQAISLEDINTSVEKVLGGSMEDVTFPEVDIKDIKIKQLPKNIKDKNRAEAERKDAIEYLTVMAYLVANNAPQTFQTQDDLGGILTNLSGDFLTSLISGNMEAIDELSKRGEKILGELKDIEVPEKMLDVHVKALKMALYAVQLKDELKPTGGDPLGQIAVLSKAQGFLGSVIGFTDEVQQKLSDYGIDNIPLNL
ncbi:MAG: thrombospondin type 3 repeat-containing protein [bacterium]|nr:thrombospondin type 3 repeat-containing protein [bacterium]